jgi:hypothetical protein
VKGNKYRQLGILWRSCFFNFDKNDFMKKTALLFCFALVSVVNTFAQTSADVKYGVFPAIQFGEGSNRLNDAAKENLAAIANTIRKDTSFKLVVTGYCNDSKEIIQHSWDRVNLIINYLINREGISAERFIFKYGQKGTDCNAVGLRAAAKGEKGPSCLAAPYPDLRES